MGQTKYYNFLGYWGYDSEPKLNNLLSNFISRPLKKRSKDRIYNLSNREEPDNFNLVWNVAYIGDDANSLADFQTKSRNEKLLTIAAISASGNQNYPDSWVNILPGGSLVLGREAFGRVPLYWTRQAKVIWFASRLQLLLPVVQQLQVNISGFYGYNCFSYVPTPLTPINEIHSVDAGTELTWKPQPESETNRPLLTAKTQRILEWRESSNKIQDKNRAVAELQILLKAAIEHQIADLKNESVGVFLSGGLDSSVVAALLVQAGVKVRAYTLDFGTAGIPEYPYAEQVAEFLQIPLVKVNATPKEVKKALIPTIEALDLPFGDGVTVPLYLLYQAASQETEIIFNGEGGDQLFAGWTNKPLIAAGIYSAEHPREQETFIQQYLRTFHRLWGYEAQVYQPQIYDQIRNLSPEKWLQAALDEEFCQSLLHRLRRATLMLKGAQNIHPRATNLAFAHGLSVRSPFCDLAMAQWTFQLSGELCLQGSCEKYILKSAVENWLPSEIVWRTKRGMGVPLTSWLFHEFWHQIGIWLNPGILRDEQRFDPNLAAKIVAGELGISISNRRIGEILWLVSVWELWRVHVLGETSGKQSWQHPFCLPHWLGRNYKRWQEYFGGLND